MTRNARDPKLAVITGAGSGIGWAASKKFAAAGYRVIGTARTPQKAVHLKTEFETIGSPIDTLSADLSNAAEVDRFIEEVLQSGPIDVFVNNAGVSAVGAVEQTDEDTTKALFDINVLAPLRIVRGIGPSMRARGSGTIINVSSMAGRVAQPFNGLYSASKFALEGLTEQLYFELKPFGIRVASVLPGRIDTPIKGKRLLHSAFEIDGEYGPAFASWKSSYEGGRFGGAGEPVEIVADTIFEAATTDHPKLRWPVGPDANAVDAALRKMTFEEYETSMRAALSWND